MKVLVFGAHPDDPESGCGGLASRCVEAGHEVVFTYATAYREGREFFGRPEKEVRSGEALVACEIFGVRGDVWDFAHEGIDVNKENIARTIAYLAREKPDVVVAHWPVDTHIDHRSVAGLALSAHLSAETSFERSRNDRRFADPGGPEGPAILRVSGCVDGGNLWIHDTFPHNCFEGEWICIASNRTVC